MNNGRGQMKIEQLIFPKIIYQYLLSPDLEDDSGILPLSKRDAKINSRV